MQTYKCISERKGVPFLLNATKKEKILNLEGTDRKELFDIFINQL